MLNRSIFRSKVVIAEVGLEIFFLDFSNTPSIVPVVKECGRGQHDIQLPMSGTVMVKINESCCAHQPSRTSEGQRQYYANAAYIQTQDALTFDLDVSMGKDHLQGKSH